MTTIKYLTLAALTATLLVQTQITRAGDHDQEGDHGTRHFTFQKCFVADAGPFGGHFEGNVAGDCGAGTVVFTYASVLPGTPLVRFAGEYTITTSKCSIKAVCGGVVDTRTGRIKLNGVVTDGPYPGDRVRVRAQLSADGNCSQGTMTLTPFERN